MLPLGLVLVYALVLFMFASWAEGRSSARFKARLRMPAYVLGLAVYCTSWTYYGAVGSAAADGWSFLPIYLGPILVFLLGFRFLRLMVSEAKAQEANSISEFIGGRFGNSRGVAALVTLLALLGSIPYLALQLRAMGTTYAMVSNTQNTPLIMGVAAVGLAIFAIIYGTKRYDAASKTDAILFSNGFESLLKLAGLMCAGVVAIVMLSAAKPPDLSAALDTLADNFAPSNIGADFFIITLLSMCAIICLPRQFYVTVIQAQSEDDVGTARWPFIAYLIVTLLVVLPIAAAGLAFLPATSRADLFVLQLPAASGMRALEIFIFLGGYSAAIAMVLIETIALSTMVSNDFVAPLLVKSHANRGDGSIARTLLLVRRIVIGAIMLAAWAWAMKISANERLASIGLISFAAMAQFAPVLILAVLGGNRDAIAAKAGLSVGLVFWFYTLALPQLTNDGFRAFTAGTWLDPGALFGIDGLSPISHGTVWSLGANLLVFTLVTMRRVRAEALPSLLRTIGEDRVVTPKVGDLKGHVGRFVGADMALEVFGDLDDNAAITATITRRAERAIASVVGLPSARAFLGSALYGSSLTSDQLTNLLDSTGKSLRFSKGLLAATLENIDPGVSVIDRDLKIVAWNSRYLAMFNYPADMVRVGAPVRDLIAYNARRGECGPGEVEAHVERRLEHMRRGQPHSFQRIRPDGRVFKTVGGPMPSGGYVMCFTDVTAEAKALAEVERAKSLLESRVRERTTDLEEANHALANADAEKTRFLAAASHDLLQPLHAAKLFSAALARTSDPEQVPLLHKLDRSIASAEITLRALLDISKFDAGGITPCIETVAVRPLLTDLLETFTPVAQEKGLSVRLASDDIHVETDAGLLRSIVQNFLSNAVRYTLEGEIAVDVTAIDERVRITVSDTGPGIPDEQQSAIFREFERLPNAAEGGMGLGLAIVERTARLLDAHIGLVSIVGKGSQFSVTLPQARASILTPIMLPISAPTDAVPTSILVLDNEAQNTIALADYLRACGHQVQTHTTSQGVLHGLDCFDVLLADFHLGEAMDGLDVIEAMLGAKRIQRAALISGAPPKAYQARAAALGVQVFPKPASTDLLDAWLARPAISPLAHPLSASG